LPYLIAGVLLVAYRKLAESPNKAKAALEIGRDITETSKRSVKNE
jgi:hypothetical protein